MEGHPNKDIFGFTECSKQNTTNIRGEKNAETIIYASLISLGQKGNVDGAYVIKDIMSAKTRGKNTVKFLEKAESPTKKFHT